MKKHQKILGILLISFLFMSSFFSVVFSNAAYVSDEQRTLSTAVAQGTTDEFPYKGLLKIYVVEPESRWTMNDGNPYHFGFLDYALEESITLDYQEEYSVDAVWDPQDAGFSNVTEDNVMVIAVLFNLNDYKEYADPPFKSPFYAHYVDASAGAKPGETGQNTVSETFTHTVFVEEGTATWCPYCPAMANALHSVYSSRDYPFYFIAHVVDMNPLSDERMQSLNLVGYPSAFFDGGDKVIVGGYDQDSIYISQIEQCGNRDVHNVDFTVNAEWTEQGKVAATVDIINTEQILDNSPPSVPTISGPLNGKTGAPVEYSFRSNDEDGDSVYFMIDWGDGETTDWIGPVASNTDFDYSHTWAKRGTYVIRAKAKGIYDSETDWGTLEVAMPKASFLNPVQQFLSHFSFLHFPFLNIKNSR